MFIKAIRDLFQRVPNEPVIENNSPAPADDSASGVAPSTIESLPPANTARNIPDLSGLLSPGHAVAQKQNPKPAALPSNIDWDSDEERSVSLPPRSPERIRALIAAGENETQRAARILNDRQRYANQRLGRPSYAQHEAKFSK